MRVPPLLMSSGTMIPVHDTPRIMIVADVRTGVQSAQPAAVAHGEA